jgi:hypothetical protein
MIQVIHISNLALALVRRGRSLPEEMTGLSPVIPNRRFQTFRPRRRTQRPSPVLESSDAFYTIPAWGPKGIFLGTAATLVRISK